MASNPITIGELVDVPAPQSAINAQFHQEVANRIVHRFNTVAQMNAWAAGNGSMAWCLETNQHYQRNAGSWQALALRSTVDANKATTDANWLITPRGLLNQVKVTGTQSFTTTATWLNISGLTVSFTVPSGVGSLRWIKTTLFIPLKKTTTGGSLYLGLFDGGGTELAAAPWMQVQTDGNVSPSISYVEQLSPGNFTRKAMIFFALNGAATDVSAQQPGVLIVEDIGRAAA